MDIFDLVASLTLDTSDYEQGLQGAEASATSAGNSVANSLSKVGAGVSAGFNVAVASVSAVGNALMDGVTSLASYGDEVDKESQKLHMSAEGFQEWSAILEHSGSSISGLKMGMKTLTTDLDKAMDTINGVSEQERILNEQLDNGEISLEEYNTAYDKMYNSAYESIGAFNELGFSLEDVANMAQNPEDAFGKIITALQSIDDETTKTALANDLLGRSAVELAPLLNTSAEETEEMRQRVHELGGVLSDEAVKASASFQDQLQDMQTATEGLKRNLLSDFLPAITDVMGGLTDIFTGDSSEGLGKISNGIDNIITKLSDKLPEALTIGSNIVLSIADSIITNAPKIISAGIGTLKELAIKLVDALPDLVVTATDIITSVIDSVSETLPELLPKILSAVLLLAEKLIDNLPVILDSLLNLVTALVDNLMNEGLPMIINALPKLISGIVGFIVGSTGQIISAVALIIQSLAEALPTIINTLIPVIPELVLEIIDALLGCGDELGVAFIELFSVLITVLPQIIGAIWKEVPKVGMEIINVFKSKIPEMKETAIDTMFSFLESMSGSKVFKRIGETFTSIWKTFKENFQLIIDSALTWGTDLIDNFVSGIKSKISAVTDTVKEVAGKIKDYIGFSEPKEGALSNFHTYAPDMMNLFAQGIRDNTDVITKQIEKSFDFRDQIVDVTQRKNYDTMNTSEGSGGIGKIIELLQTLAEMDIVRLDPDEDYLYNVVRRKNLERINITGSSGLV